MLLSSPPPFIYPRCRLPPPLCPWHNASPGYVACMPTWAILAIGLRSAQFVTGHQQTSRILTDAHRLKHHGGSMETATNKTARALSGHSAPSLSQQGLSGQWDLWDL